VLTAAALGVGLSAGGLMASRGADARGGATRAA